MQCTPFYHVTWLSLLVAYYPSELLQRLNFGLSSDVYEPEERALMR